MLDKLNHEEMMNLTRRFGAGWCGCLKDALKDVTPSLLAKYCVKREFKPFPEPSEDETGIRYAYFLSTLSRKVDGVERDVNQVASFGDYAHFPMNTCETVLQAIWMIALHDCEEPIETVKQVLLCKDEPEVPVINKKK